jgi:cell division septation protein DedD
VSLIFSKKHFLDAKVRKKNEKPQINLFFCRLLCTFAVVIELQRHIEILLLDNDCVIVPDFGGFVAHQVASRYDEDDHMLLPPMRTLGFNPQLRINDSLLVQSYINALDISYPEALRRIESEVDEMKQVLSEEGYYTLENIGTLRVNSDGNIEFEPCEAGILSPEFYGLSACEFPTLKDAREARLAGNTALAPIEAELPKDPTLLEFIDTEEEKEERAIQIKLSWIRNAVAVAAAVVAFFLMATPIANSDLGTTAMSNLQGNLLTKLMPKDTNMAPAQPIVKQEKISENTEKTETAEKAEVSEPSENSKQPNTKSDVPSTPTYCIVLASQVKLSNAESYVEQLKARGMNEAEVYIHHHIVRVVYGSYESESEAYRHLNKLNKRDEFAEAWVYKKSV